MLEIAKYRTIVSILILLSFLENSYGQSIDWSKMANTTWELQSVHDETGSFIHHSNEKLSFHNCEVDAENIASFHFTWENLPFGGKISGGQINARGDQFVLFDLPDNKSAEYHLISSWDSATQTITIVNQWGIKRIFRSDKPVSLGEGFTTDATPFIQDADEIKKMTQVGRDFLEKGNHIARRYVKRAAEMGNEKAIALLKE